MRGGTVRQPDGRADTPLVRLLDAARERTREVDRPPSTTTPPAPRTATTILVGESPRLGHTPDRPCRRIGVRAGLDRPPRPAQSRVASRSPLRRRSKVRTATNHACAGVTDAGSRRRSARRGHPRTGAMSAVSKSRRMATCTAAAAARLSYLNPDGSPWSRSQASITTSRRPAAYATPTNSASSARPPASEAATWPRPPPLQRGRFAGGMGHGHFLRSRGSRLRR